MPYPGAEDMAKVRQALADLRVDERNPPSLAGLIGDWNDLACRDQLARVQQVAPAVAEWLTQALQEPDDRFRAATRESSRPQRTAGWFMNRIPRHPGPELARDIDGLLL
jgi:hypothetical protein